MGVPGQPHEQESIGGERRRDRRYDIQLELRWKLIRRRKVLESGTGRTIDFSSKGVLFDAFRELAPGLGVELSISWPVLLQDAASMRLVVSGKIVRVNGTQAAVRISQHEFRTAGVPQGPRVWPPSAGRTPSAVWLNVAGPFHRVQ